MIFSAIDYRQPFARGLAAITLLATAAPALAQDRAISLPAMPLGEALRHIASNWHAPLTIDAAAIKGVTANAVVNARTAREAVEQATHGLAVSIQVDDAGAISMARDIVITAHRDEAETKVIVRGSTTSSRLGQSLRDQPRNAQVISAKLLQEQQTLTLPEALANAGGVVVNSATVQGGVGYSVRGFPSNGSVNGLPSTSSSSFAAGASEPLANVERIEVLKGPDAILLGGDNLGGTINIVTKKPSAEQRLNLAADTGSFGLVRGTLDANQTLSDDRHVSGRVIASAATANRNFGGYRGNQDYLLAPSLRFKNAATDVLVSISASTQIFGVVPYTVIDPASATPFFFPTARPLIGGKDQGARIGVTQFNGEITQRLADWVTIVLRAQHQRSTFALRQYSPLAAPTNAGVIVLSASGVNQQANTDAIDSYARFTFKTGPLDHKIVAGGTYVDGRVRADNAVDGRTFQYNFLNPSPALPLQPFATRFAFANSSTRKQVGVYAQYLLGLWKVHLLAGLRRNAGTLTSTVARTTAAGPTNSTIRTMLSGTTTPNYGAVVDVTPKLSLFGSLAFGFLPTLTNDRFGNRLPDVRSRNAEAGIKWDLFKDAVLLNASWFSISQSNLLIADPTAPGFQTAIPGQIGRGIDLNVSGQPISGLSLTGAFTRTSYRYLIPSPALGTVVAAQPRDVYNLYASYMRPVARDIKTGFGAGVSGRSSAAIDRLGKYYVPPAIQANLSGFLTIGKLELTIGVRNLFDRRNYATTNTPGYIPLGESRNWRLTLGYRFF